MKLYNVIRKSYYDAADGEGYNTYHDSRLFVQKENAIKAFEEGKELVRKEADYWLGIPADAFESETAFTIFIEPDMWHVEIRELETEDDLEVKKEETWAVTDEEMDCREHTSYFHDYASANEYFEKLKQEFLEGGYYKELHEEYPEEKFIMEDEDDYFYFLNDVAGLNSYCITMGKIF